MVCSIKSRIRVAMFMLFSLTVAAEAANAQCAGGSCNGYAVPSSNYVSSSDPQGYSQQLSHGGVYSGCGAPHAMGYPAYRNPCDSQMSYGHGNHHRVTTGHAPCYNGHHHSGYQQHNGYSSYRAHGHSTYNSVPMQNTYFRNSGGCSNGSCYR